MIDRPLVFLGTPGPAAAVLESLIAAGHDVVRVITGVDKRRGRGSTTSPSPVKMVAERHSIPVDHDLSCLEGDLPTGLLGIVVAYGRIIPASVLARVPMWNVHFSLLPRWRGAAPVARAIMAGDASTGVCIMEMESGLDTGGVLASATTTIRDDDTTESLTARLTEMGALLLDAVLNDPNPRSVPQFGEPTYAHKIDPSEGRIDWRRPSREIHAVIRALRAYTEAEGLRIRVVEVEMVDDGWNLGATPGEVSRDGIVRTGDGGLRLVRVQQEGKPVQAAPDWLRGWRSDGRRFDSPEH